MTGYERQCRWLLRAFPSEFRRERGEDLVGALLDDAPSGARRVSIATAVNLVASGARMRAVRAGAVGTVRRSASGGMALAAVIGLGVQAALAVASAAYKGEHGLVFYVPTGGPFSLPGHPLGVQFLLIWIALAVASVAAFVAAVRGAWRVAAILSVAASAYLVTVAAVAAASAPAVHAVSASTGAPVRPPGLSRYMDFSATPGLLAIGAVAAALSLTIAVRSRRARGASRTSWWLAAGAVLAVVLVLVGDGNAAQGTASHLSTSYPPQGGIMTVLQILVVAAVGIGLLWSIFDPRVGWAVAVLTIPFVIHQVSDLTMGNFYYGYLYQPGWETALPLVLVLAGVAALATSATLTSRRLRRP